MNLNNIIAKLARVADSWPRGTCCGHDCYDSKSTEYKGTSTYKTDFNGSLSVWLVARSSVPRPTTCIDAPVFGWVHNSDSAYKRGCKPSLFRLVRLHAEGSEAHSFYSGQAHASQAPRHSATNQALYISSLHIARHVSNFFPPISLLIPVFLNSLLRASPIIPQTGASNWNIVLYTEKTTSTVSHFIKFGQKITGHPLKCIKHTTT
jgi:hypothetical protein